MNPGKLIDPVAVYDPIENLRIGAGYQRATATTWFQFPADEGSFAHATTRCVGVGACRKVDTGTMCPSYMATREEKHSTRGRAHLLWEMMQGNVIGDGWRNHRGEGGARPLPLLQGLQDRVPGQRRHGHVEGRVSRALLRRQAAPAPALTPSAPWIAGRARLARSLAGEPADADPGVASLAKTMLDIAPQRSFRRFARRNFRAAFHRSSGREAAAGKPVLLWPDTWNNYFHPQALHCRGQAADRERHHVAVPQEHICCGRPLYDFGFLDEARSYLRRILDRFEPQIDAGVPSSCSNPAAPASSAMS